MSFKKQSVRQLEKHIRHVALDTSTVLITDHARVSMRKRHVLDAEVYECLRKGKIHMTPEEDMKTGHLVCRMECYGPSRNLAVVTALEDGSLSVIVVTVIVN